MEIDIPGRRLQGSYFTVGGTGEIGGVRLVSNDYKGRDGDGVLLQPRTAPPDDEYFS